MDKLRREGNAVDLTSICSPNYLHDAHIRFGLRSGSDVICEKPLVLNPGDIDTLVQIEKETGKKVNTILQLRLHPAIIALRNKIASSKKRHAVDLTYITSRGRWYHTSWKGEDAKSGGVATNIGVHFFDMLAFIFGPLKSQKANLRNDESAAGLLAYEKADVRWFLSIDSKNLPDSVKATKTIYRSITVDGDEIEFSEGFTDLHTDSYREILAGNGFGLNDVRLSVEVVSAFRTLAVSTSGDVHPFVLANRAG